MTGTESDRGSVGVIARAAAILRTLEDEPKGLSLGAIAKKVDCHALPFSGWWMRWLKRNFWK